MLAVVLKARCNSAQFTKCKMFTFVCRVFLAALCFVPPVLNGCYGVEANAEVRLIKQLLENYDVDARPVKSNADPVLVQLKLVYNELLEVDEPKQTINSVMSFEMRWNDALMQWNESEYDGISSIRLDPSRVWKPDLTLYNSVDKLSGSLYSFKTKIQIDSTGTMAWLAYGIVQASCPIEISKFPFDEQTCKIKIGSWTFNGHALKLSFLDDKEPIFLGYFKGNTEWELVSASGKQNLVTYACCSVPYYDLTYTIHLRRKPLYYIMTVVLPCVLLSLLSTSSFLFPAESGERVSLIISVLLGLFVFMLIVNDKTPVTSDTVPIISQYFTAIGLGVFLTLLATAFILWMHHASSSGPVPHRLTQVSRCFAFVFRAQPVQVSTRKAFERESLRVKLLEVQQDKKGLLLCLHRNKSLPNRSRKTDEVEQTLRNNNDDVQMIVSEMRRFSQHLEREDFKDKIKEEWQHTAKVFDKMFFFVFLLTSIILNGYVLSYM